MTTVEWHHVTTAWHRRVKDGRLLLLADDTTVLAGYWSSIESVWSILKRSIHGTWHHVSPKHLGKYVNEATFRLNEGNCEVDTIERMESLAGQIGGKRLPYAKLVRRNGLSSTVVPV